MSQSEMMAKIAVKGLCEASELPRGQSLLRLHNTSVRLECMEGPDWMSFQECDDSMANWVTSRKVPLGLSLGLG